MSLSLALPYPALSLGDEVPQSGLLTMMLIVHIQRKINDGTLNLPRRKKGAIRVDYTPCLDLQNG